MRKHEESEKEWRAKSDKIQMVYLNLHSNDKAWLAAYMHTDKRTITRWFGEYNIAVTHPIFIEELEKLSNKKIKL